MREEFIKIAQTYLGMTPKDKGCRNWNEMQILMVNDLESVVKKHKLKK